MKLFNQIFIASIFIIIIFVVQNKYDYKSAYSNTVSYLQKEINRYSDIYGEKMGNVMDTIGTVNTINDTTKYIDNEKSPGALIVADDYLTYNTKNIVLSSKGVIEITNKYRNENGGLVALKENSKLNFSAEKKLQDMFVKQYFEHVSPEGISVGDLGSQSGYEYIIIGENLALGNFKDDKALVDAWMASPGHRANILNIKYTEIGVAVAKGVYNGKNVWMAVQHFALPKSACPTINEVLRNIIDLDQKRVQGLESDLASQKAKIDSGKVSEGFTANGQIDNYNSLVNDYNKLILNIKEKINKYNEEVRNFNSCIEQVI